MDKRKFSHGICPVGRGLALIGDAWSMLILRDVGFGMTRFDQFRTSLGIAPNILARRLKALTAAGLLRKQRYSQRPPRDEYVLTEAGRDFLPVLQVLGAWGRRHNGRGELSYVVDVETGAPVEPLVIDRRTGAPIGSRPLRLVQPEAPVARRHPGVHRARRRGSPSPRD
jgi:DNA-binding HxlR family transcriptional regulator